MYSGAHGAAVEGINILLLISSSFQVTQYGFLNGNTLYMIQPAVTATHFKSTCENSETAVLPEVLVL
jgi:hypothetical protein